MLGRFLEISIATPDIQASLDFYLTLGFSENEVGEAWTHPYAVVTDGRVCIGLHEEAIRPPILTFVKPDLLKFLDSLEPLGIRPLSRALGSDVFNEVGWQDPSGHLIRVVEARTFSPSKRPATDSSLCGYFIEIALPELNAETAKNFWEHFGFVGMDESTARLPHVGCTSDTIDVGLYDPKDIRRATLLFEAEDVAALVARLAALGVHRASDPPPPPLMPAALFTAPEGTPILIASTGG